MLKTVFVVGAGASAEFGLGVGTQLAFDIQGLLRSKVASPFAWLEDRTDPFNQAVSKLQSTAEDVVRASETIRRGLPLSNSIDDFLHENRENTLVVALGKLAIAHCMLRQEERASVLAELDSETIETRADAFRRLRGTWIELLFRILKRARTASEARDAFSQIAFVTFNYDRCIEQFLYTALADAFDLDIGEAREVGDTVQIEHIYGSLGPLPIQKSGGLPFAAQQCSLTEVAQGIKTYTEEVSGTSRAIIEALLSNAEQLAFLGYAFHQQGLNLLLRQPQTKFTRIFWTELGVHQAVRDRFSSLFPAGGKYPVDGKCADAIEKWQFTILKD